MNNNKKTFENFHMSTWALFQPCKTPDREPDFISPSLSCYWDEGDAVLRASNHWAGHNGCSEVASCIWMLDGDEIIPGEFATGICRYDDFKDCSTAQVEACSSDRDLIGAALLRARGGLVGSDEWLAGFGDWQPAWAFRFYPGRILAPAEAKQFFSMHPEARFVVSAQAGRLNTILRNAEIKTV